MTLTQLVTLAANRLAALNTSRSNAVALGDVERLNVIDAEIEETETTLQQLRSLNG